MNSHRRSKAGTALTGRGPAGPSDRFAYLTATGAGAGSSPFAPGTLGAIEGVALYLAIAALLPGALERFIFLLASNIAIFALGVWASGRTCRMSGLEDPSHIVVDEISGQLIALTPLAFAHSIAGVVAGFVLFRLFDIFKPYPIRRLEALHGGLGVMADDGLAGIYSAILIWTGMQLGLI
ncbi:MAG TPA: phosphatidylglycerophosphatase A [Blastocatellia bacterium]|jgi:phosphatidylglycerophosphatase A|nr:phosphatidylglycerophosphatase A [Blastocatellia bacterium]